MRVISTKRTEKTPKKVSGTLILREAMAFHPSRACAATYSEDELRKMMQKYMIFDYARKVSVLD
ncbi:MAG: hypothetical protein N2484_16290 [Clostridia bacterium]|nr:hypothetical protein [Clostridia bacterium]